MEAGSGATPLRFDTRVIWPDGSIHWLSAHGSLYRSAGRSDRLTGLVSDITERMRTTEALQDASRNKDEFLAMPAHELRNPLAPISAAAQIITMGRADPALTLKAGAITGYGSKGDREHSAHAGINHHLTKPVDTAELNRLLADIAPQTVSSVSNAT